MIRASAELIARLHPAVAFVALDAGPARAGAAVVRGWRVTGGVLVRVVMLAIALDLAWPMQARSQMPLAVPAPRAAEMPLALPAPPAAEVPAAPRAVEVPPAPPAAAVPAAPPVGDVPPAPSVSDVPQALPVGEVPQAPSVGEVSQAPPAAEVPPIATDARVAGDDQQTRLVIDVSQKVDMRAFALADPYRVVIEIPQVDFRLPPNTGDHGRGIIKAFRYGLVMPGRSRIVLDLAGPVRVRKAFVLDPVDGQPARMVLDLNAVDRETFLRATAIENHLPRPPDATHGGREQRTADPRPVVVLDPGHGGIDPGTRAPSGELEKDIVLEFASLLRAKLEATGKYRVVMTRTDDAFVELAERVRLARAQQAQLLISIHCDALPRGEGEAEGATVYTLSDKATDEEAQRLADAENRADVIAGVDLAAEPDEIADILIDLAQRETRAFSAQFAHTVVKDLRAAARLHKHPQRSAGFRVLKAPDVPSVLIELGYVSNARNLKQLTSESWRSRAGDAIVHAVHTYFATRLAGRGAATRAQ